MKRTLIIAVFAALGIAGCGGSSSHQPAPTAAHQTTLAQVCQAHPEDIGTIAGGVLAFKTGMDAGDTTGWNAVASDTAGAVTDLEDAAVGATSPNLPAMRAFLSQLQSLSDALNNPPKYPTAVMGDRDVQQLHQAANAAGCSIGG